MNGDVIVENNNSVAVFNYSFQLDSYYFNLVQLSDVKYDIKINNNFFEDIIKFEISGDLKKSKMEREKQRNDDFFPGQSINTIKLDDNTNNDDTLSERNPKILNKIGFFPNDNNNPLSFTFKDKNNNMKKTGNFNDYNKQIINEENNDINNDIVNDYPSLSEL